MPLPGFEIITAFDAHNGVRRTILATARTRLPSQAICGRSVLLGGREVLAAFEALHCVARDRRIDPHPVEAVRTLDRSVHGPPPVRSCVPTTRATELRYTDTALTHTLKGDLLHKSYARSKRFAGKQFPTIHVRTAAPPDMLVPPAESQVRPGRVPPMKRLAGIALVLGVLAAAAA